MASKYVDMTSRLAFADLVEVDGVAFWDLPDVQWTGDLKAVRHIRGDGDRIDLAAYDELGDASLWWVIAGVNGIGLAPVEYDPESGVKIPSARDVFAKLGG